MSVFPHQLSLSACSDPQRAWEGPHGSLTYVLCKYLGKHTLLPTHLGLICILHTHSNATSPIIPQTNVSYQVRHLYPLLPPPIYSSASPSFFSSFKLHENARELHEYTRSQKQKQARGEGAGFDGELDNFQEPNLSSLSKLVRLGHYFCL